MNIVIVLPRVYGIFFNLKSLNMNNDETTTNSHEETSTSIMDKSSLNYHVDSNEHNGLVMAELEQIQCEDKTKDNFVSPMNFYVD